MHPDRHGVLTQLPDVRQPVVTQVPSGHVSHEQRPWLSCWLSCSSLPRRQQGMLLHTLSASEGYMPWSGTCVWACTGEYHSGEVVVCVHFRCGWHNCCFQVSNARQLTHV